MENERRLEILGILVIALSVFILVSLTGYNPNEEPSISPNIQIENPMGILGVFISHLFIKIGFGYITILIPLAGLIWGWFLFAKKELDHLIRSSIYLSIAMVLISVTIGVISESMLDTSYRYFISGQVGGVVGKISKVKYCIGGIRNSELKFGKVILNKILHNYVNKCTIYNNFSGYEYYTKRGFDKEKAIVIPNCIDDIPSSINRDEKQYINVLSVGRFHHQKDFLTSLKSVKKITSKSLPIKYTIIGYGELEKQIRKYFHSKSVEL